MQSLLKKMIGFVIYSSGNCGKAFKMVYFQQRTHNHFKIIATNSESGKHLSLYHLAKTCDFFFHPNIKLSISMLDSILMVVRLRYLLIILDVIDSLKSV